MSTERLVYSEPDERCKMEHFGIVTIFAKDSVLNFWEGSKNVSGFKHDRDMNILKFLKIWQGSEYASGCHYGQGSEYA